MRVTCKHCGGAHPAFECRKRSTATGKDRLTRVGSQETDRSGSRPGLVEARLPQHATEKPQAGTQALPVDTNSEHRENEGFGAFTSKNVPATTSAGTVGNEDRQPIPKRARGRPRTIADMRAYKAMKQREYRERKKNER